MNRKVEAAVVTAGMVGMLVLQVFVTPVIEKLTNPSPEANRSAATFSRENPFLNHDPQSPRNPLTEAADRLAIIWEEQVRLNKIFP